MVVILEHEDAISGVWDFLIIFLLRRMNNEGPNKPVGALESLVRVVPTIFVSRRIKTKFDPSCQTTDRSSQIPNGDEIPLNLPISAMLSADCEIVSELPSWRNGTLSYSNSPIHPIRAILV